MGRIPDSLSKGRITEIKDVRKISYSKQFKQYAKSGKRIDLIVSKHSKVSKPLINAINKSGGKIKVRYGKINIILIDNIYKFKMEVLCLYN